MEADGCRILASFDCYYRECNKAVNRECYKEPVIPVCFLHVKAIGVMPMIDQGEADDKIIAVCAHEREYKRYNDNKELPPHRLAQIRHFFADCIICLCRMQPE